MLLNQGYSQSQIARAIEKDRSVVCREIKRNSSSKRGVYHYEKAQQKTDFRKQGFHRRRTFTRQKQDIVIDCLKKKWFPEQITGYCIKHGIGMVSHESIYQFIREDRVLGGTLYTHLRHRLKHRKRSVGGKYVVIKDKVSIEERLEL